MSSMNRQAHSRFNYSLFNRVVIIANIHLRVELTACGLHHLYTNQQLVGMD